MDTFLGISQYLDSVPLEAALLEAENLVDQYG